MPAATTTSGTAETTASSDTTASNDTPVLPDTTAAAELLFVSTVRLARRLRQLSDTKLTPSQHSAMMSIHRHGPLTLGALAELERVAQPTTSRVVAKLESDGLVERLADPDDGRLVRVVTTPLGEDLLDAARSRKVAWIADQIDRLDVDDRAAVLAALPALQRLQELP